MQNSKRVQRILKKISELQDIFMYYTNGNAGYTKDFNELRDLIEELALDKKQDHARFAKKLKGLWNIDKKDN